jgi:hypothetical protein
LNIDGSRVSTANATYLSSSGTLGTLMGVALDGGAYWAAGQSAIIFPSTGAHSRERGTMNEALADLLRARSTVQNLRDDLGGWPAHAETSALHTTRTC